MVATSSFPRSADIARRAALTLITVCACSASATAASLAFFENAARNYDYGRQTTLPAGFGDGDFTLEIWLLADETLPVGSTAPDADPQRNWSNANPAPYSTPSWWYSGNFLLDGHNNTSFHNGTFSLQLFNGGRVRWLFGDGSAAQARPGGLHAIQQSSSASLLDGQWHQVTLVRRASGDGAILEMWIDGAIVASETTSSMTNMRTWWDGWPGFPETGWVWGAEKQAALGTISQYEDYKGNIDELRFWSRAKSASEIASNYRQPVTGSEPGLVGHYDFESTNLCNQLGGSQCISTFNLNANARSLLNAPLTGSGDTTPPTTPTNPSGTAISSSQINLSWTASTDNVAVLSYRITRNGSVLSASPSRPTYSDTALTPGTTYTYSIAARDTSGNVSAESTSIQVTTPPATNDTEAPTTPGNLRTTSIAATQVGLTWNASTDNVGIAGYNVYRDGSTQPLAQPTTTSFTDTTVSANTSYSYTVAARDAAGNTSAQSTALTITTTANPPPSGGGGGGQFGIELIVAGLLGVFARRRLTRTLRDPAR